MFMPGFEVYDLSLSPSDAENSILTVETHASDLTAIRYNREHIFMGFSNGAVNNEIQVYTYNYEKIKTIPIEFNDYLNNMSLLMNDRFIVGSHSQGRLSIINLETDSSTVLDSDAIDDSIQNVWGTTILHTRPEGEPQIFFAYTNNGLYKCCLTEEGEFINSFDSYLEGHDVQKSIMVNDYEILVSLKKEDWNKVVLLNTDTSAVRVIIPKSQAVSCLGIARIPTVNTPPYYMFHTCKGLYLVNLEKGKNYALTHSIQ